MSTSSSMVRRRRAPETCSDPCLRHVGRSGCRQWRTLTRDRAIAAGLPVPDWALRKSELGRPGIPVPVGQRFGRGAVVTTGIRCGKGGAADGMARGAILLCDCGQYYSATLVTLRCGHSLSCGCGAPSKHTDHIIPLSQGGTDLASNRQRLCIPCHVAKTTAECAASLELIHRPLEAKCRTHSP